MALLRRLRSRLPVSPLPWHWHRRLPKIILAVVLVLAAGGAIASVVAQRSGEEEATAQPGLQASPPALAQLQRLKPKQKADALILATVTGPEATEIQTPAFRPGGVVVSPEAWAGGGAELVSRLRASGGEGTAPPLIVARQEGGIYRAYPDLPPLERQLDVGDRGDPVFAQRWAAATAAALKQAGFDLNLAPVADVATLDSAIADRAFSDDPEVAAAMTAAAIRGCRQAQLACAVSHFPGLGAASADTAAGPATVGLDAESLEQRDLAPFRAAIAEKAPAVVLSLAFYAAIDPVTPGALSSGVVGEMLRADAGFEGVAITDDLSSGAITAGLGAPAAAVQAISAGADMVQVSDPADLTPVREALRAAVASGEIAPQRLDQAVARALDLKRKAGLLPKG